jgi:hypothetical protein
MPTRNLSLFSFVWSVPYHSISTPFKLCSSVLFYFHICPPCYYFSSSSVYLQVRLPSDRLCMFPVSLFPLYCPVPGNLYYTFASLRFFLFRARILAAQPFMHKFLSLRSHSFHTPSILSYALCLLVSRFVRTFAFSFDAFGSSLEDDNLLICI